MVIARAWLGRQWQIGHWNAIEGAAMAQSMAHVPLAVHWAYLAIRPGVEKGIQHLRRVSDIACLVVALSRIG